MVNAVSGVPYYFDGGAGGAPTRPSFVNGEVVSWRIASTSPNTSIDTPHTSMIVAAQAPDCVQLAPSESPGSICHTRYAPYKLTMMPPVIITLPTIWILAEAERVPISSMPDVRVQASTSNAHPPTISRLITTSVGRCHFPATKDNATSSV